jgi:tetratricopeptide (TPR) repeat protein
VAHPLQPDVSSKLIPVTAEDVARRRSRIVLLSVGAVIVTAAAGGYIYKRSTDPLRAQESFEDGRRLMGVTRYDQAILSFDRAIALKTNFPDAYLWRARCHLRSYNTQAAIPDLSKAIELRPSDSVAFLDRGGAYLVLKKYSAAIADASAALAIDSRLASAYNLRGSALRDSGNPQAALADFSRAVEIQPNGDNYYQRGATEQQLGQHNLAIADFGQAIEFVPDMALGYFARAESERAVGDLESAKRDHERGRLMDGR